MRVLLDTCVAVSAKAVLQGEGHEVEHVGNWPNDPGDAAILAHAAERATIVITLDKDFGELAIVRGARHRDRSTCRYSCRRSGPYVCNRSSALRH